MRDFVEMHGQKQWQDIAHIINQYFGCSRRQGKQCRERWINFLSPDIKRDKWSLREELTLMRRHQELGNQWALIAKRIPGRTENQVKNKFNSLIKRIREEKTYGVGLKKVGLQQALGEIEQAQPSKAELEVKWIKELIDRMETEIKGSKEEFKGTAQECSSEEPHNHVESAQREALPSMVNLKDEKATSDVLTAKDVSLVPLIDKLITQRLAATTDRAPLVTSAIGYIPRVLPQ